MLKLIKLFPSSGRRIRFLRFQPCSSKTLVPGPFTSGIRLPSLRQDLLGTGVYVSVGTWISPLHYGVFRGQDIGGGTLSSPLWHPTAASGHPVRVYHQLRLSSLSQREHMGSSAHPSLWINAQLASHPSQSSLLRLSAPLSLSTKKHHLLVQKTPLGGWVFV